MWLHRTSSQQLALTNVASLNASMDWDVRHSLISFGSTVCHVTCIPLCRQRINPLSVKSKTISNFFNECPQHLCLCACVESISANLNNPQEQDALIGSLKCVKEILDLTHDEQASNNPAKMAKHQQGNVVLTLEEVSQRSPLLACFGHPSDSQIQKKEPSH